jgi:hypothetical protein
VIRLKRSARLIFCTGRSPGSGGICLTPERVG